MSSITILNARRYLFLLLLWGGSAWAASPGAGELRSAQNLQHEAEQAVAQGKPLVVLFSRADCRYCDKVRQRYLLPLASAKPIKVVVRQVNLDSGAELIGFDGQKTTHARFAAAQRVSLVPVVAFYGVHGEALAEPILGAGLDDFYLSYLGDAITRAEKQLRPGTSQRRVE